MTGYLIEYLAGLLLFGLAMPAFFTNNVVSVGVKLQVGFAILLLIAAFFHYSPIN